MLDLDVKKYYGCHPKIPNQAQLTAAFKIDHGAHPDYSTPTEIGIEVELEKCTAGNHSVGWKATKDGSLKDQGIEFISHPLRDVNVPYALLDLEKHFDANPKSEFSHRCSIHVHMNVSKLTVGQLRVLIATYIVTEGLFFRLVDPLREGNSYCFPMRDMCLTWKDLEPGLLNENFKYCALNPHHLMDFGTLEFRHHGGTKSKGELLNWIETILQLYKFVEKHNPQDIEASINNLNTISHYSEFCRDVFDKKFEQFMSVPLYRYLRNSVTSAKVFLG